jgi:hypothetical protein
MGRQLTALDSNVFPVPDGPVKSKQAFGRLAFPSPVRDSWIAFTTASMASGCPMTCIDQWKFELSPLYAE